jgi:subtilisin family serine protease
MKDWGKFIFILIMTNYFANDLRSQEVAVSTIDSLDKKYLNWYNEDKIINEVPGASVDKAYQTILMQKKPLKKVIVAVIDCGVDIYHEDLKGRIWTNQKEIPGNNIDDDHNGYIDDVHGWNFIGNTKGENIQYENFEYARLFKKMNPRFKNYKSLDEVAKNDQNDYVVFSKCKEKYTEELERYTKRKDNLEKFDAKLIDAEKTLKDYLGKSSFTIGEIKQIMTVKYDVILAKDFMLEIYKGGYSPKSYSYLKKRVDEYLDFYLNIDTDPRKIISDNPEDMLDRNYGNNDVKGPNAFHGTFVAGIIAAIRNNNIGVNGISENVEIMPIRAIPEGDERDKDVALAIRYAVDNGADIINMSFGKIFSPQKSFVDEAIKYAEAKNVLIIHAAGNDAKDIDTEENYPSLKFIDNTYATNMINVGASTLEAKKRFCTIFTNYGQKDVHLFAPGSQIISLCPENKYNIADGTSFSCPVVAGVAALVLSYYPKLTASELKNILLKSCTTYSKQKVYCPNLGSLKKKKVRFSTLSVTGGVVNAYEALRLAEKM